MLVLETERDLVVVDCGMLFPTASQPGIDYILPDVSYVRERAHKLRGYLITHAHEDHIGALPYVVPELPAPIYGTRFTLDLIELKQAEFPDFEPELVRLVERQPVTLGDFTVEPLAVTHSIPGAVALAVTTPAGLLVHTGDFKIDRDPVDGRHTDVERFAELGRQGVAALLSDSTNSERPGWSWSERQVGEALHRLVQATEHRVVVTTFSSNIHRLQLVIDASVAAGRSVMPVGRSVAQNVQMSLERGHLTAPRGSLVDPSYFEKIPRSHLTIIASGSQGEPESSMTRIAAGQHPIVQLDADDTVLLSSRRIPGNELAIGQVVNNLVRLGCRVIDDRSEPIHTSGHAFADEQRHLLDLLKPHVFVPVHGEYRHLARHAELAISSGVQRRNVVVVEDGTPVVLERGAGGAARVRVGEPVRAGHVYVDGRGVGDVGGEVLRDRRMLAETGMAMVVAIFSEKGELLLGPHIVTRGVTHEDSAGDLLERATAEVARALGKLHRKTDDAARAEEMRVTLRRFFKRELERRPLVLPLVLTV